MADSKAIFGDLMSRRQEVAGYPPFPQPNYNGGSEALGTENPTDEQLSEIFRDTSIALNYITIGLHLAEFGVKTGAGERFKSDLRGAKEKMETADRNMLEKVGRAEDVAGELQARGYKLDDLRAQLAEYRKILVPKLATVNTLSGVLKSALDSVKAAEADLASAEAYAKSVVRSAYPPGVAGTKAFNDAKKAADDKVKSAKLTLNNASAKASLANEDYKVALEDYEENRKPAEERAKDVEKTYLETIQLRKTLAVRIDEINGPLRMRSESIRDMANAQQEYMSNLAIAFDLSQAAVGLRGLREFFQYASVGRYFTGGAALFNSSIEAIFPYLVENSEIPGVYMAYGFVPGIQLFGKAILEAGKVVDANGNFMDWAENFGEATVGAASAMRLADSVGAAFYTAESNPYAAGNQLVELTGEGIDILGKIGTTVAPFVPSPVPISPAIKPATTVAKQGTKGLFQTGVSLGYVAGRNRLVSAPIGSGQVSGFSLLVFSPFATAEGVWNNLTANRPGDDANDLIRRMAENGSRDFIMMPTQVLSLRPSDPSAPNPYGRIVLPPLVGGEPPSE